MREDMEQRKPQLTYIHTAFVDDIPTKDEVALEKEIDSTRSFEDLFVILRNLDAEGFAILGSSTHFEPEEVIGRIENVRQHQEPIDVVTRALGIRKAVMRLLEV